MANPKARSGFFRRLATPPWVMVATAGLVFLSLSDHRIDQNGTGQDSVDSVAAAATSAPVALTVAPAAPLAPELAGARARDRLVVAAIRPEQGIVQALMPAAQAQRPRFAAAGVVSEDVEARRDWEGDALVGPLPAAAGAVEETTEAASIEIAQATVEIDAAAPIAEKLAPTAAARGKADKHLPFQPLREPALAGSAAKKSGTATKGLEALIPTDGEHTVRYVREITHEVRSGETLSTVLSRNGVGSDDVTKWVTAIKKQHDANRIYAGQTVSMLLDMPEKRLRRVSIDIGREGSLVIEDNGTQLVARKKSAPYQSNIRVVEGEITSNLSVVASAKGVPDRVISEAAEVLGWEINLGRDLQPGARFRLAYEETMRVDTRESWSGRLLAIELSNEGKSYEGFHFATADGKTSGYYNRKGEGLGRAFLRYPVSFSRISSQFSTSRYHPVLKRSKPHYGVDFAAPTGTPVKAAADGVVSVAGWQGGNGRFVKIRHNKQYESGYAHLSRIASGVRPGTRVKQGQVIGYVGSTGLATGPHLHFAMYSNGKYVDPLKAALPRTTSLGGSQLASFKSQLSKVEKVYAANGMTPFGTSKVATAAATRR